jgi:hypothetical protein
VARGVDGDGGDDDDVQLRRLRRFWARLHEAVPLLLEVRWIVHETKRHHPRVGIDGGVSDAGAARAQARIEGPQVDLVPRDDGPEERHALRAEQHRMGVEPIDDRA